MSSGVALPLRLVPMDLLGGLAREDGAAPIADAVWYSAKDAGAGISYRFPLGALVLAKYVTADMLLDGRHTAVFVITLQEGDKGPKFDFGFSLLNQCSARVRMPTEAVSLNRWRYGREGAWLTPTCGGSRIDLAKVDRLMVRVLRKSEAPVRWCMTDLIATAFDASPLVDPVLPKGPLVDETGQSAASDWPGKTKSVDEMVTRLCDQLKEASRHKWPDGYSKWGGSSIRQFDATGFFRTQHDGKRWWLVDPEGYAFWSAGMNCARVDSDGIISGIEKAAKWLPERKGPYSAIFAEQAGGLRTVNLLAANFIRAFGPDLWYEKWAEIALAQLRRFGFNTFGNWSDWRVAKNASFPYVRTLSAEFPNAPKVFRDFPDVYDPWFREDLKTYAQKLRDTADDPAMLGYFLMSEPTWGFTTETPAAGMLLNHKSAKSAARQMLAALLQQRHRTEAKLSAKWGVQTTFAEIIEGQWTKPLNEAAQKDLTAFSTVMVQKLFDALSDACRKADPNHLNLGARYFTVPPPWALDGMKRFDVFSVNFYRDKVSEAAGTKIAAVLNKPVIVGEWHFGALDAGLPGCGAMRVRDQEARGRAFRVYAEDAASKPWCVGAHWFALYDQSALGRLDGANGNIGFLDICNRPYEPLAKAARASHERIYKIAIGETPPFAEAPDYLPRLFL